MAEWMRDFVRATAEECKAPWSGGYNGKYFRCYFCGDKFVEGSEFRMIFTNDGKDGVPGGNPLTCRGVLLYMMGLMVYDNCGKSAMRTLTLSFGGGGETDPTPRG